MAIIVIIAIIILIIIAYLCVSQGCQIHGFTSNTLTSKNTENTDSFRKNSEINQKFTEMNIFTKTNI